MIKRIEKVFSEVTGRDDLNFTEKTRLDKNFDFTSLSFIQLICGLEDEFDIDIDDDEDFELDSATIGGWAQTMLDGEAEEGSQFSFENLVITILQVDGVRIERLAVEYIPTEDETESDAETDDEY